jgi:hypothetical protein
MSLSDWIDLTERLVNTQEYAECVSRTLVNLFSFIELDDKQYRLLLTYLIARE